MNISTLTLTEDDRENNMVLHYCTIHGGQVVTFPNAAVTCKCGRTCHTTATLGMSKGGRAPLSPTPPRLIGDRLLAVSA